MNRDVLNRNLFETEIMTVECVYLFYFVCVGGGITKFYVIELFVILSLRLCWWKVEGMSQHGAGTRGADKSLERPGRKQTTATKLGIYSTHSPRSSMYFFARCSNFCKASKIFQKIARPTRSPRQQNLLFGWKMSKFQLYYHSREQAVVRRGQIRRIG